MNKRSEIQWLKIISTIIIPAIKLFIDFHKIRPNSHWPFKLKTPSADTYVKFLVCINVLGALATFVVLCLLVFLDQELGLNLGSEYIHVLCSVIIGIGSLYTLFTVQTESKWEVSSKIKSNKLKVVIPYILGKGTILVTGITWTFSLCCTTFVADFALMTYIFLEIVAFFILDSKARFEYKYVSFLFKNGKTINKVETEKVIRKGEWVYVKCGAEETSFNIESIEKVIGSNSILDSNVISIR